MYPAKIICRHFICCVYNRNKIFYCLLFTVTVSVLPGTVVDRHRVDAADLDPIVSFGTHREALD
jgi:hypothetical protein